MPFNYPMLQRQYLSRPSARPPHPNIEPWATTYPTQWWNVPDEATWFVSSWTSWCAALQIHDPMCTILHKLMHNSPDAQSDVQYPRRDNVQPADVQPNNRITWAKCCAASQGPVLEHKACDVVLAVLRVSHLHQPSFCIICKSNACKPSFEYNRVKIW